MTERLATLLHQEVDRLTIPVPPVREALAEGRRLRRRRRLAQVVAIAAAVAVVGAGAALVGSGTDDPHTPGDGVDADTTPTGEPVDFGTVFAVGDTVYLDSGARSVRMPEVAQTMYYTSTGLLVRTNATGDSDGGAPFHFSLIRGNGSVAALDLTLGEVVPATDPRQPYIAYAQMDGDTVQVAIYDVGTDEEVARLDLPDVAGWGGWEAPPVGLDGEFVYVGTDDGTRIVNWRTGEVSNGSVLAGSYDVRAGRAVVRLGTGSQVVDVATGERLLDLGRAGRFPTFDQLSPDGRYLFAAEQMSRPSTVVYDLETGKQVRLQGPASGWTTDDRVIMVLDTGVLTCDPDTGQCSAPVQWPQEFDAGDFVRVAGRVYES